MGLLYRVEYEAFIEAVVRNADSGKKRLFNFGNAHVTCVLALMLRPLTSSDTVTTVQRSTEC